MNLKKWMLPVVAFMALQVFTAVQTPVVEAGLLSKVDMSSIKNPFKKAPKMGYIEPGTIMQLDNGIYYQIMDNANSYEEAYRYASSVDGRLAILDTPEDCQLVYDFMVAQKIDSAYIGLADHMFNGKWRWPNGTSPYYTNWKKGEPNRSSKRNMYAMLSKQNKKGTWSAGTFRRRSEEEPPINYIIQWDPNEKTLTMDDIKAKANSGGGSSGGGATYRPAEDIIEG